jgi:hypothetical protein
MSFPSRRIEVVIDELILHGIDPRHGHAVAAGLRSELAVALADWRPPARADLDQLDTGAFGHRSLLAPNALGQAVARHIAHALPSMPAQHQGSS